MMGDLVDSYTIQSYKNFALRSTYPYLCPSKMEKRDKLHIDIGGVLRQRLPRYYRLIPGWLVRRLEMLIRQDRLNALLDRHGDKSGPDFCAEVLYDLGVDYRVHDGEKLPSGDSHRFVIVCNHPLGGLDGIAMIDMVNRRYGGGFHFVVNDLLMAIPPLRDVFLPVNKHGRQSRVSTTDVDAAFEGDAPIVMFPAGLCSRRDSDGVVCDLEWHKMFVNKCIRYRRDVIPVFFDGCNSTFFYNFAQFRLRLGLKFNFEMALLPGEVFKAEGKTFDIYIGDPIAWNTLDGGKNATKQAALIKDIVYRLCPKNDIR